MLLVLANISQVGLAVVSIEDRVTEPKEGDPKSFLVL